MRIGEKTRIYSLPASGGIPLLNAINSAFCSALCSHNWQINAVHIQGIKCENLIYVYIIEWESNTFITIICYCEEGI